MNDAARIQSPDFDQAAFRREDEEDDARFYRVDRMVPHLDGEALRVVSEIIGALIVERRPRILDLMASWDSHLGDGLEPEWVAGLGMNNNELDANPVLDERVVHDLNRDPRLPFEDNVFDAVLNTVSVDYLTRPFEVFADVARVLKPGGVFLVLFSNRFFPDKVVRMWKEASGEEREGIVEHYFASCGAFEATESAAVHGRPRPEDDRHARTGRPSDPIHAVWAEKRGGEPGRPGRKFPDFDPWFVRDPTELARREAAVAESMACPYCGERLRKWLVPQTPFTEWDQEFLHICFNDRCPYLMRGWQIMEAQGNHGLSYRLMYNPGNHRCMAIPIPSLRALRESIVDDDGYTGR